MLKEQTLARTVTRLSPEDARTMAHLYTEIQKHKAQMATIALRVLSAANPAVATLANEHKTHAGAKREVLTFKGFEMECFGSGENMCLCYDHDEGTCSMC